MSDKFKKIIDKYPNLYGKEHGTEYFSCGPGWADLLEKLSEELTEELKKYPEDVRENFYPTQVKEKYATLRYYTSISLDTLDDIIDKYEIISSQTCESCGGFGEARNTNGWWRTICEPCQAKREKK